MKNLSMVTAAILLFIGQGCNTKPEKNEAMKMDKIVLDAQQEVLAAYEKRRTATLNGDANTVASMMTDDLTFTHSSALVETKEQFIEALKSRKSQFKSFTDEDRKIRVNGSTGVVSGICHIVAEASGTKFDLRVRFTELWVKEGDTWRMMLWHSTKVQ